jgi:hypothetical protein
MSDDVELILQPAAPVKPQETRRIPAKVFCADHNTARSLLKNIVLMIGAMREVELGSVEEKDIKVVAVKTQEFLLGIGDQLMVDTGMGETIIAEITKEIEKEMKKPRS